MKSRKRWTMMGVACMAWTSVALAEPPADAPGKKVGPKERAEHRIERREEMKKERAERMEERMNARDGGADGGPDGRMHRGPRMHGGFWLLSDELRSGKLKKGELKERLEKMRESMKERRKARQEALKELWGRSLLKTPARQELRVHARRVAFLERAMLVARTERTGKDQEKLIARVEKLLEQEQARHQRAMARLSAEAGGTEPAGSASAAPSAPPAEPVPSAAPAPSAAEEKAP